MISKFDATEARAASAPGYARFAPPEEERLNLYAPDLRGAPDEDYGGSRQTLIFVLMLVVLLGVGGALFAIYGGARAPPLIQAEPGPYKTAFSEPPTPSSGMIDLRPKPPEGAGPQPSPSPSPSPGAPAAPAQTDRMAGEVWLAQVAALRSQAAADEAWRRLAAQDPRLFAGVTPDVQMADLGARGVYFRLRAGAFSDREAAMRFCDSVKALGQDCMAVRR